MLPFTPDQFLAIFVDYNQAIWPGQIAAYLLGGIAVALLFWKRPAGDQAISGILAVMWLWTAIAYHALFFASINKAAYLFAALFFLQGICFVYEGCFRNRIHFSIESGRIAWAGIGFVFYATILYPLIGSMTGHSYAATPMFGVTPCPVAIFTLGMLLATEPPISRWLLVIPFIWSLIGGSAALLLHVPQDWFLLVSGLISVPMIAFRPQRTHRLQQQG
jgi:hypothetical protein